MTLARPDALPRFPLANHRDLGGIAVAGGKVRAGRVQRADDVSYIDQEGAQSLVDAGLTLVIDLRSPEETTLTGRGLLADYEVDYLHLPFTDTYAAPGLGLEKLIGDTSHSREDVARIVGGWYASIAELQAPRLVEGFAAIVETSGTAVFHCAAGKDRTGVFAASLLKVLGASDDAIVADYARTTDSLGPLLARLGASMQLLMPDMPMKEMDLNHPLMSAHPETMQVMLGESDRRGGIESLLRDAGLDDALVAELRGTLIES